MGVNSVPANSEMNDAHNRDVKLSYYIKWEEKSAKVQAVKIDSKACYDEALFDLIGLMDRGVDPVIAIDIRVWFLEELGINVPTLKIGRRFQCRFDQGSTQKDAPNTRWSLPYCH
ncbi:hypothetical protein BDR22DRAFT_885581 [Usnea florida]